MTNEIYIKRIDALIPEATQHTNSLFKMKENGHLEIKFRNDWTRTYLAKMNELAITEGLRDPGCV